MQFRKLGNSGIDVSVVGLGTWAIGGWAWGGTEEQESVDAIHAAIEAGINLIDTAPMYGMGVSEEFVGKAIADRRDKVVLATKCGLVWDTDRGEYFFDADGHKVNKYLGPESIKREVEDSLKRLGTDYIDLMQTHWQESTTPIQDTMATLTQLKAEGKILSIGASNATVGQLDEYRAAGEIDADQELFSMLDRKMADGQLKYCAANNIGVLPYSPMALGLLTGTTDPDRKFGPGDLRTHNPRFAPDNVRKVNAMLDTFKPIAEAHNATIAQTVIAWTFSQTGVTSVLCGGRKRYQALENAAAGDIVLTASELAQMNATVASLQI